MDLTQLKLNLKVCEGEEQPKGVYDSYLKDLQTSMNKTAPQLEDHELVALIIQALRSEDPLQPKVLHGEEHKQDEGLLAKVRRKLSERS